MSEAALKKKMTRGEFKSLVSRIVEDCKVLAARYVETWEPVNPEWKTVQGAAYLRLSTDQQVSVEKGSLEQQIYIAISEAVNRSKAEKVNYRIVKFFIEPGITARHDKRPEFIRLQMGIEAGRFRFVIFKELARIARETEIWKRFFRLCINKDCEICIRSFPFNPNDPSQIFQLDIMAAFAEYESNQTSKRIKENIFSAMVHSGKFNTTHQFLGLDRLAVNGEPKVGLYSVNDEEMKQVIWLMKEFLVCRSYEGLLEKCESRGVSNKGGEPFTTTTLRGLLTNSRYIGKWVLNRENKDRNQDKLMPYDRYMEIDLPHGQAVPTELWEKVQATIVEVAGMKLVDKATRRIYPLSRILRFKDGTNFVGSGAWSRLHHKHIYYWNQKNKIRIPAEVIEEKTKEMVDSIIGNSVEFQQALKSRLSANDTALAELRGQLSAIEREIARLGEERAKLDRRLDYILDGAEIEAAKRFREEYRSKTAGFNLEIARLQIKKEHVEESISSVLKSSEKFSNYAGIASEAQRRLKEENPIALRTSYAELFAAIVVGEEDQNGYRKLDFVLRDDRPGMGYRVEDVFSARQEVVDSMPIK